MSAELKSLLLMEPKLTLAVAESLTAGHLQARVAAVSGASGYFVGGITAYALEQKVKHLGVDRALAEATKCVSGDVAKQMARGVCGLFSAAVGVATTGFAERSPEDAVDEPFAWWAVAVRDGGGRGDFWTWHGRVECPGASRVDAQQMVADAALTELVAVMREVRQRGKPGK